LLLDESSDNHFGLLLLAQGMATMGVSVAKKAEHSTGKAQADKDWSPEEVRLIEADYFEMLLKELLGQPYNKAEHRRRLAPRLQQRTRTSIEYKHQNISAVLVTLGLPYIYGYKPARNFQRLLGQEVEAHLDQAPTLLPRLAEAPLVRPAKVPNLETLTPEGVIEPAPERLWLPREEAKPWLSRKGRRINFAERDAHNELLGRLGEEFALWYERQRLLAAGRDDLAGKIQWVARDIGDGLGFDILSFNEHSESEKYIEVKATGLGKYFPFYVTDVELRCSEDMGERFSLFRIFDFSREPRLYILNGSLGKTCELEPTLYRAHL
jgi:hypothetical protein